MPPHDGRPRTQAGRLEAWSFGCGKTADAARALPLLRVAGDRVRWAAPMPRDPYVLLGCSSGTVRVMQMVGAGGGVPATDPRLISGMELLEYAGED